MRRSIFAVSALALVSLSACTHWPDKGQGGNAEYRAPALPMNGNEAHDRFVESVKARYECEISRLDAVREAIAAKQQFTGQILQPEETAIRAKREIYGNLLTDSQITLDKLSAETTEVAEKAGVVDDCSVPPPCDIGERAPAPVRHQNICPTHLETSPANAANKK